MFRDGSDKQAKMETKHFLLIRKASQGVDFIQGLRKEILIVLDLAVI